MISASLSSNATAAVTVRVRDMNDDDVIVGVNPSRTVPVIASDTPSERRPSRIIAYLLGGDPAPKIFPLSGRLQRYNQVCMF